MPYDAKISQKVLMFSFLKTFFLYEISMKKELVFTCLDLVFSRVGSASSQYRTESEFLISCIRYKKIIESNVSDPSCQEYVSRFALISVYV